MNNKKIAIIFVSGSVGELDWNLEILEYLIKRKFFLKIIILKKKAYESIKKNKLIYDFINKKNENIELFYRFGYFVEKLRHYTYLAYRILLKLKIDQFSLTSKFLDFFLWIFHRTFIYNLPDVIKDNEQQKFLFLTEFPSLRFPWNVWIRKKFKNSVFIYHPHSQSIYATNFEQKYDSSIINYNKKNFLLLGHQLDYLNINDGKELASNNLEKIFIGHPNWSNKRILRFISNKNIDEPLLNQKNKTNVLILSKHFGSYFDEKYHSHLAETSIKVIKKIIPNSNIFIKKHPRESKSRWDILANNDTSIKVVNFHVQQIATKVDFVISIWNSASVDCYAMGIPVIEYYDPNRFSKNTILIGDSYTTVYRMLGVVIPVNNENELQSAVKDLVKNKFKLPIVKNHTFYNQIINLSNTWEEKIKNILISNNLL